MKPLNEQLSELKTRLWIIEDNIKRLKEKRREVLIRCIGYVQKVENELMHATKDWDTEWQKVLDNMKKNNTITMYDDDEVTAAMRKKLRDKI